MGAFWKVLLLLPIIYSISSAYKVKRSTDEFTAAEKDLLRSTYKGVIEPLARQNAANMFIHFITEHPDMRKAFPWGRNKKSDMALRVDPHFVAHSQDVFNGIAVGIGRLDNMKSLDRYYTSKGIDHIPRRITPEHFGALRGSFNFMLKTALGDDFTKEVKDAYEKYYNYITADMLRAMLRKGERLEGITDGEVSAVQAGFAKFGEDFEGNGAATFITLVNDYPELKNVFPWGQTDDLSVNNPAIRRHGEQVFSGIAAAVDRINNIHSLDNYYESLGLKHIARSARVEYFDYIKDALIQTFKQILGSGYNSNFENGLSKVYGFITSHMAQGLRGSGELSREEKAAVVAGFDVVKGDIGLFGAKVFARLLTANPEMRSKFPWGAKRLTASAMLKDKDVKRHGELVFNAFGLAVQKADDIDSLSDYFYNEGLEHIVRNIDPEDFDKLLNALLYVFQQELGGLYTVDFKKGIESLYSFVTENIMRGMRGEGKLTAGQRNELAAAFHTFEVDLIDNGIDVFINLVNDHPTLLYAFPWGQSGRTGEALRNDPAVRKHANQVFPAIAPAFKKLTNLESLSDFYLKIGNDHLDRNIPPVTFSYLSDAFKKTFKKVLGAEYTGSFEESFDLVYHFITSRMIEGMTGSKTLSAAQKEAIKSAYARFAEDLSGNGVLVFLKFVHDYPELLKTFPWGGSKTVDYEQLFDDYRSYGVNGLNREQREVYNNMANHAQQVFSAIGVAVDGIDHLDGLASYYNSLGVRHIPRGVTAEMFLWMGDALSYGFKHVLGSDYSEDLEQGFRILYQFIIKHIGNGLGGGVVLTRKEQKALQDGFARVRQDLGLIGANTFVNMIEANQDMRQRFPWADNDKSLRDLRVDRDAIAHGEKVLHAVDLAVQRVDQLNTFVPYFIDEGIQHVPRLVKSTDFRALSSALLPAFEEALGDLFTEDFKSAFISLMNFISDQMSKGLEISSQENIHLNDDEIYGAKAGFGKVSGDVAGFGARVFARLVAQEPTIRKYFPWGRNDLSERELIGDPNVRAHARQVFGALEQVIDASDHLNNERSFLIFKGMQHIPRGIKSEHFKYLEDAFLGEIKFELGDELSPEGESGLKKIFDFVRISMSKGLSGSKSVSFGQRVALERGIEVFEENLGENGAKVFIRLLKNNPSLRPYFPWGRNNKEYAELLEDPAVHKHAEQVFGALAAAVHHAENLDATRKYYYDLGVNHVSRAVKPEHFAELYEAVHSVFGELLGENYNNDFSQGFKTVYDFVVNTMVDGLGQSTKLSTLQKEKIRSAFSVLESDVEKYAGDTFIYLITKHPDLKAEFPWGDVPTSELRSDPGFIHHVTSVFSGISVAIDRIDDLPSTVAYYSNLGRSHVTRGATKEAFQAIGEALLNTLKKTLGIKYNKDFETSFLNLYDFISGHMQAGLEGAGDVTQIDITDAEKRAVKNGFSKSLDLGDFGREVFVHFIEKHPSTRNNFPWALNDKSLNELKTSEAAKKHGEVVFTAVAAAVDRIDRLGSLSSYYYDLGVRHIPRELKHKHFAYMIDCINHCLRSRLGSDYSENFKSGFSKILNFITGQMEKGMSSGKLINERQRKEVARAWSQFSRNLAGNGAAVFAKLVTKYPDMKDLFPWGNNANTYDGYKNDPGTRSHAASVFKELDSLFEDMTDLQKHKNDLTALGRRHIPRNVELNHLIRLGVVLDEYFEEMLGDAASLDFRQGFDVLYANIVEFMAGGLRF